MSELKPLIEGERDEVLLRILRSADDDVPGEDGRGRTFGVLGLGEGPLATPREPAIAAAKALGLTGWKVVVAVAALVVTLGGGVTLLGRSSEGGPIPTSGPTSVPSPIPVEAPPASVSTASTASTASTVEEHPAVPTAQPAPPPTASEMTRIVPTRKDPPPHTDPTERRSAEREPPPEAAPSAAPTAEGPRAASSSTTKAGAPTALGMELAALDEARSTLASRGPAAALARLDRYDREFARPQLGDEATMLRIEALHAKGDLATARVLAHRFLTTHAGTTYEDRVRSLLGTEP